VVKITITGTMDLEEVKSTYPGLLRKYLFEHREEEALYEAYKLGKECFEAKIGIEDIMSIHTRSLEDILRAVPPARVHDIVLKSSNLLMELSIRFGLICQNYFEMLQQTDERIRNAFYKAEEALTAGLDLNKMLSVILDIIKNLTDAAGCAIMLLEDDRTVIRASEGLDTENEYFNDLLLKVIREGRADSVYDLREEKYRITLKDGREIRSVLALPLSLKSKMRGAFGIYLTQLHHFEEKEINLLTSFAYQATSAIDNAYLFSELELHDKMLDTLYAIENVVSRSLDLEEVFNVALSKVLEVTGTEAGTLYSLDGNVLRLEAFRGLSPEFKEKAIIREMGEGIPGIAAQSKKAIAMDISQFPSPPLLPYVTREKLVSFIGTPLMSKGKVVGALALGTRKKRIFTRDDLDLLFSIGNAIGIAVENARLYKESRENYQKLQKAYEELQTLDKMKDEFISNVSHEIKTPLIPIRGYAELLYDEKLGAISNEQKRSLEAILRNTDRLTRLIDSILFISRLQARKVEFYFEPVDLDEVVSVCVGDFKSMMDKKKITFEKVIHGISRIRGERDRVIEVVNNLLDNSIKFTPMGGRISIKAWNEEENVHLTVSDNGIGIPEEIIPKLFMRFYQVDASAARRYGGAGLGLYIAKNIVDAFGGKIWIESEVGKGTTVHVLLPVAREFSNYHKTLYSSY